MRFFYIALLGAILSPLAFGQSSTSSGSASSASASARPSNGTNSNTNLQTITTTITSLIPGPSGSASSTSLLTLTLTLNSTSQTNTTLNGTTAMDNSTMTNVTEPWKAGDDWIPFHIRIDPAYGVLGGILILSGIPVAGLGGKNRWSSLAIVSGYSLMLFTLVMILRFGVQDNLQPPSPSPPSTTLRGLYLLACLVASFIGAGIGIFFFNIAKYFVSAAGGFAFGWFLLETKSGGLITSVLGRWGLLGGLTVAALLASIVPNMVEHMTLASTAWIGATAFMLGVDCFTRAGLKEFYIYNLGFHSLFPKLEGAKYPLTQTMIIELGILAAVVLIGAAIQARVLNRLQKRLREAREEEEMRLEADEVSKAAERFKNVGSELAEWEEKHGKGGCNVSTEAGSSHHLTNGSTSQLPMLSHAQAPSSHLPPIGTEGRGMYSELALQSPPIGRDVGTPTTAHFDIEELKDESTPRTLAASPAMTDPELEGKIKLLEEVKRARESIRGSIDELRKQTPTPSLGGRLDPGSGSRPVTPAYSLNGGHGGRPMSVGSRILDDIDPRSRKISGSSSNVLDAPDSARYRRQSTTSSRLLDITRDEPQLELDEVGPMRARQHSNTSGRLLDVTRSRHVSDASKHIPSPQASPTEWDRYVSDRQIVAPPQQVNPYGRAGAEMMERRDKTTSMIDLSAPPISRSVSQEDRRIRTTSMLDPGMPANQGQYNSMPSSRSRDHNPYGDGYAPGMITGSASSRGNGSNPRNSMQHRSMTYEELSDRHRKRISALQNPVSSAMKEEEDLRMAREKWERQKREERAEMQRRQQNGGGARDVERDRVRVEEKQEVLKTTDEWRRSVHGGLDGFGRRTSTHGLEAGARPSGGVSGRGREKRMSHIVN